MTGACVFLAEERFLFQGTDGTVMSTAVRMAGGTIEVSVPKPLFKLQPQSAGSGSYGFWPTSDGQRFLVIERDPVVAHTTVVLNWAGELKQ